MDHVHNVRIVLNDEEEALIKAMIKEGIYGVETKKEVIARMFYLQLREDMDAMHDELVGMEDEE